MTGSIFSKVNVGVEMFYASNLGDSTNSGSIFSNVNVEVTVSASTLGYSSVTDAFKVLGSLKSNEKVGLVVVTSLTATVVSVSLTKTGDNTFYSCFTIGYST